MMPLGVSWTALHPLQAGFSTRPKPSRRRSGDHYPFSLPVPSSGEGAPTGCWDTLHTHGPVPGFQRLAVDKELSPKNLYRPRSSLLLPILEFRGSTTIFGAKSILTPGWREDSQVSRPAEEPQVDSFFVDLQEVGDKGVGVSPSKRQASSQPLWTLSTPTLKTSNKAPLAMHFYGVPHGDYWRTLTGAKGTLHFLLPSLVGGLVKRRRTATPTLLHQVMSSYRCLSSLSLLQQGLFDSCTPLTPSVIDPNYTYPLHRGLLLFQCENHLLGRIIYNSDMLRFSHASESKSGGNWRRLRKPANQRYRPARFPHAKVRSDPAGDRTRFALSGGEQSNRSTITAPCSSGIIGSWHKITQFVYHGLDEAVSFKAVVNACDMTLYRRNDSFSSAPARPQANGLVGSPLMASVAGRQFKEIDVIVPLLVKRHMLQHHPAAEVEVDFEKSQKAARISRKPVGFNVLLPARTLERTKSLRVEERGMSLLWLSVNNHTSIRLDSFSDNAFVNHKGTARVLTLLTERGRAVVTHWTRIRQDPGLKPCPAILISVFHGSPKSPQVNAVTGPKQSPWQIPSPNPLPCATCTVSNDLAVDETLSPITYLPTNLDVT
ncbi:hypothetical protein PR048_031729 [Dryococelus australis]|uniref:Uncharacterized protein n=1 Tax=Dryococelus australis TaxID=614101 RepID=A0ABQ9G639_9NEOP|nr:hypothetical protein PR048_031729 [Dryococelus australis]